MMHLGAFVHETGQHVAAWRHPEAHFHSGASFADAVEVAQTAERGKFDFLVLADTAAVSLSGTPESRGRMGKVVKFEPMTILSALAAVTQHLGLVSTSTTSYSTPSWGGCRWVSSDTQVTMKIVIPAAPPSKDGIVGKPPTLRVGVQADPSLGAEFFWRAWQTLPSRQFTAWTLLPLAPPPTGPGK